MGTETTVSAPTEAEVIAALDRAFARQQIQVETEELRSALDGTRAYTVRELARMTGRSIKRVQEIIRAEVAAGRWRVVPAHVRRADGVVQRYRAYQPVPNASEQE